MARTIAGRRSIRQSVPQRRKFVWARAEETAVAVPTTGIQLNLLAQFEAASGANLIGATVARIRGVLVGSPQATGDSELVVAARVSAAAATTAGLGPEDSPYLDWMMWEPLIVMDSNVVDTTGSSVSVNRIVDIKAMRRLEEINEQLTLWVQGTAAWDLSFNLSVGLLLP